VASFAIKPNIATSLSSYSGDYLPGNTIKGYRLVVKWGENECEYAFIIRGDAAILMTTTPPDEPPRPQNDTNYEIGRVWLAIGNNEHEPGEHFLHGAMNTGNGLLSASGIPFEFWLLNNLSGLPEIQYTDDMKIIIDGEYGRIITFIQGYPMYYEGYRQIRIPAVNFIDGMATITLPYNSGTYLIYVDVHWSGGGSEFTLLRYVFKIVREFELADIPGQSPQLYINIIADGLPPQRLQAAKGTTSWFPAGAFMDRWQVGDTISGGYEATGDHPLNFWRETWECIDFDLFRTGLDGTEGVIEIRLESNFPPTSLYVRRWSTELIGTASEMWNDYEPVEVIGNLLRIHNDGNDYIYEVEARWARGEHSFGRASYTFCLNSK
jgi:hypothetical protein